MNLLGQRVVKCNECAKEFLYFGVPSDGEEYFCSADCTQKTDKQ